MVLFQARWVLYSCVVLSARYFDVSVYCCCYTNDFNYKLPMVIIEDISVNWFPEITETSGVSLRRRAPPACRLKYLRQSHFTARNVSHRQPPTGSTATVRNFNSNAKSQRLGELPIVRRFLSLIFLSRLFRLSSCDFTKLPLSFKEMSAREIYALLYTCFCLHSNYQPLGSRWSSLSNLSNKTDKISPSADAILTWYLILKKV